MNSQLSIYKILKFIWNHPFNNGHKIYGVFRFFKWQIQSRVNNSEFHYPITSKTTMIVRKGMKGVTGNIYCGLLEFEDILFLLHSLREDDLFVDVGANVGVYTTLVSKETGAQSISIEPISKTFEILSANIKLNKLESKTELLQIGIGDTKGELSFTNNKDSENHVIEKERNNQKFDVERVRIDTLDNICNSKTPLVIKIDVEGFETKVLHGAKRVLNDENLKGLLIELNGSGSRYGFDDSKIHKELVEHGFKRFKYEPYTRKFAETNNNGPYNTLYLKDLSFFESRVKHANRINILNKSI